MGDFEYMYAVYFTDEGKPQRIYVSEIQDTAGYEAATKLSLLDPSEQFQIVPRLGGGVRRNHFTAVGEPSGREVFNGEIDDETHNKRVSALLENLKKAEHFIVERIITKKFPQTTQTIGKIYGYHWKDEVHRIVSENAIIRHDIFGQSTEIEMSVNRPWVAIEVIHTHFPEEAAYQGMLSISRAMPLMVLFDCTDVPDYFLKVSPDKNSVQTRLYILDGNVYLESNKLTITCAAGFKAEVMKAIRKRLESLKWRDSQSSSSGSK